MKKSTLIKLVKEQISKDKLIKENKLAGEISSMIPDNTSYGEFAKAVATVLVDFYGKHNYEPFMKVLHSELGIGDSITENESNSGVLNKQQLIAKIEDLKKADPTQRVRIPKIHTSGTFDTTGTRLITNPEQALEWLARAVDTGEFTQDTHDAAAFSLVQSKEDLEKVEKMVKGAGSLD